MNFLPYLHSIWLSQRNLAKIFENNSDYEDFFNNLNFDNLEKYWIKNERINELLSNYNRINYKKIDEIIDKLQIKIITLNDREYPDNLRNIPNPPFILYIRWNWENRPKLLSVVWSRKSTKYSETVLKNIIPWLIKEWFWIVSWWAYWVDSIAHKITLENNWYTMSIIGTGIDKFYPQTNKTLFEEIILNNSCIISIFRIGTWPDNYNFPIRNEIIAGLSLGTLITEAWEKSGTLITAKLSLELNRDVFVIPWDITRESSSGSNSLIRDWLGKLTINTQDILNEYNIMWQNLQFKIDIDFTDELEKNIYELLTKWELDPTSISDTLWIDIEIISMKLSIMEISALIKLCPGWVYVIN